MSESGTANNKGFLRAALGRHPLISVQWGEFFSWSNVGWYVALIVGIWGALMGTGDYTPANILFTLSVLIAIGKWAHHVKAWQNPRSAWHVARFLIGFIPL